MQGFVNGQGLVFWRFSDVCLILKKKKPSNLSKSVNGIVRLKDIDDPINKNFGKILLINTIDLYLFVRKYDVIIANMLFEILTKNKGVRLNDKIPHINLITLNGKITVQNFIENIKEQVIIGNQNKQNLQIFNTPTKPLKATIIFENDTEICNIKIYSDETISPPNKIKLLLNNVDKKLHYEKER